MAAHMRNMRVCFLCQRSLKYLRKQHNNFFISRSASDLVVNHKWKLDPRVEAIFNDNPGAKHRLHPGKVRCTKKVQLPAKLQNAIELLVEKYPTKDLEKHAQQMAQYMWSRHRPAEDIEIKHRAQLLEADIRTKYGDQIELTEEEVQKVESEVQQKLVKNLRKEIYHWKPLKYNAYEGFLYLIGRISQDYSTLFQIFSEIAKRNPKFSPKTMFDFGSGVGSSIWAANETWQDSLKEHYCVDPSSDMNTIARLLLQDGEEETEADVPGVYFRQFMPSSSENQYDLVVSAFSLMELPNQNERLNTLYSLWQRTQNYLVIVENGTNAGFQTVLEARDFILQFSKNENFSEEERTQLEGHVFAPCPHDKVCGRFARRDGTPCNFAVDYKPLKAKDGVNKQQMKYSYVVLKKGPRPEDAAWPRVVREVSTPSKRAHIRTCSPNGEMQLSVITSAKHGKNFYWCARACKWGDLLPGVAKAEEQTHVSNNESTSQDEELELTIEKTSGQTSNVTTEPTVVT